MRCLTDEDLHRLEDIRWCPVQFQAFVPGTNVRVHTVGTEAFATEVETNVTDYRYVHHPSEQTTLHTTRLPDEIIEACLRLAGNLDLPFAGIDLKLTPDGRVYCFEVNPSPAYSYFEAHTDQPIALALARYLVGIST